MQLLQALITAKTKADPKGWLAFQTDVSRLKLQRSRALSEAAEAGAAAERAERAQREAEAASDYALAAERWEAEEQEGGAPAPAGGQQRKATAKIVLVAGFESFNAELYRRAAVQLARLCPGISLRVFSDRDIGAPRT